MKDNQFFVKVPSPEWWIFGPDCGSSHVVKGHRAKVSEKPQPLTEGLRTMVMDQSASVELLEMLKAADVDDRIRAAAESVDRALIDAEATEKIGAGR